MDLQGVEMTWLGHATTRFRLRDGSVVLVDPWLQDNPACPDDQKQPDRVDAMFITHAHFDHIGDAVEVGKRLEPDTFAIFETSAWLQSKGVPNVTGLNKGGTVEGPGGVRATLVNAVHSCGIEEDDGSIVYGGDPGGWVLQFPDGPCVYHAGDTMVFGDMDLIGEIWEPDVALLPIGDHFVMDPTQAAYAAEMLDVATVVPIHFGTFPVLTGRPDQLREELDGTGIEVAELEIGKPVS
jgi:L-ascorbate metabolism protein UlaG (beta-lactamase superfamily)